MSGMRCAARMRSTVGLASHAFTLLLTVLKCRRQTLGLRSHDRKPGGFMFEDVSSVLGVVRPLPSPRHASAAKGTMGGHPPTRLFLLI